MSDFRLRPHGRQRTERAVELRVSPRVESLVVVRTLVGAMAAFADLNIDTVSDLRLAADELCTRLIRSATADATLVVVIDPSDDAFSVEVSVDGSGSGGLAPGSFSWHVLTSLVDDVQPFHAADETRTAGEIFGVTLTI